MNTISRHNLRIIIVKALYSLDLNGEEEIDKDLVKYLLCYAANLEEDVDLLYQQYSTSFDEAIEDISKIYSHLSEINEIILRNLENYKIERLNFVDRAIIRFAVYEMIYKGTPNSIAINEALEITKEYSNIEDSEQVKFNNSVLDKINKDITNGKH